MISSVVWSEAGAGACRLGPKPLDDAGYLEAMASSIFRMGFSREVVEKKWPAFVKAFTGFSIDRVAEFGHKDVACLMSDAGIIRNPDKIESVIDNARVMRGLRREFKSFGHYLRHVLDGRGEEEIIRELGRRFSRVGPKTALVFLRMTGFEMADTMKMIKKGQWTRGKTHGKS